MDLRLLSLADREACVESVQAVLGMSCIAGFDVIAINGLCRGQIVQIAL